LKQIDFFVAWSMIFYYCVLTNFINYFDILVAATRTNFKYK